MKKFLAIVIISYFGLQCRQTFLPPVTQQNYNYLVVDGFVVNGPDSTIIRLSRTTPISDSETQRPEFGASISVIGEQNDSYGLIDNLDGSYYSPGLSLNPSERYKLRIVTSSGGTYESDLFNIKTSPAIDSVSWDQSPGGQVNVNVSSHDPQNSTRFYRWDYIETWQYHPRFQSSFEYIPGTGVVFRDPVDQVYNCWHTRPSSDIIINSTEKLASDVVFKSPVVSILAPDERLNVKYSILVRQYAIDKVAFNYYHQLQQNSEKLGSIFGSTPSQLGGNVHNTSNSSEVVIGFIGGGTVSSERIFISNDDILPWPRSPEFAKCDMDSIKISLSDIDYYFKSGSYIPLFYHYPIGSPAPDGIYGAVPKCADCRLAGGTTTKPSYWP